MAFPSTPLDDWRAVEEDRRADPEGWRGGGRRRQWTPGDDEPEEPDNREERRAGMEE